MIGSPSVLNPEVEFNFTPTPSPKENLLPNTQEFLTNRDDGDDGIDNLEDELG